MKLKWSILLNPLGNIIQENYGSFYPSGLFTLDHFTMRHPVSLIRGELRYLKLFSRMVFFLVLNKNLLINSFPLFQLMALRLHPVLYRFTEFGYTQMS